MRQNVVPWNDHFVYAFVDVNIVSGNDTFDVQFLKLTPFCTRFNLQNMIILMTLRRDFRLESGKMQE